MEDGEAFRDEGYAGAWCGAAACTFLHTGTQIIISLKYLDLPFSAAGQLELEVAELVPRLRPAACALRCSLVLN